MAIQEFKKGNKVMTGYGEGVVLQTRPQDGVCVVQLPYGTIYTSPNVHPLRKTMTTVEIIASFEACEKMRKLNWEVECNEMGIRCDHSKCKICVLDSVQNQTSKRSSSYLPSIRIPNPLPLGTTKKVEPCLLCANPTCTNHSSKSLQKEKITLCLDCESLFQSKGLEKDLASGLQGRLEQLTDAYDRAFLILRYSTQFLPELVQQLQSETALDDKVALGTSSVGFVSGAMGFAGAATLLTPAGPPLLLASFVFGTSNAAVGLGYSAQKYWQSSASPTHVANRLLALYGFLKAAMERIVTLREQVQADPNLGKVYSSQESKGSGRNAYLTALSQGVEATKRSNTTLRVTNAAGYTTSSSVFDMVGAAPIIGQAFSAAMMVLDYQTATATLEKIKKGSPSEKAHTLQQQCDWPALSKLPTTSDLEAEVKDILRAVESVPP